jgi:hypothetical protein
VTSRGLKLRHFRLSCAQAERLQQAAAEQAQLERTTAERSALAAERKRLDELAADRRLRNVSDSMCLKHGHMSMCPHESLLICSNGPCQLHAYNSIHHIGS